MVVLIARLDDKADALSSISELLLAHQFVIPRRIRIRELLLGVRAALSGNTGIRSDDGPDGPSSNLNQLHPQPSFDRISDFRCKAYVEPSETSSSGSTVTTAFFRNFRYPRITRINHISNSTARPTSMLYITIRQMAIL